MFTVGYSIRMKRLEKNEKFYLKKEECMLFLRFCPLLNAVIISLLLLYLLLPCRPGGEGSECIKDITGIKESAIS